MSNLDPQQVATRETGHFQSCFPDVSRVRRPVFPFKGRSPAAGGTQATEPLSYPRYVLRGLLKTAVSRAPCARRDLLVSLLFVPDGKTGLLTGLLGGKQGWKCPVALLATCCGSKSLKVILIDSDFRAYPVLNPLVTL